MRSILHTYLSVLEGLVSEARVKEFMPRTLHDDCVAILLLGAPAALAIRHRLLPDSYLEDRFADTFIPSLIDNLIHEKRGSI